MAIPEQLITAKVRQWIATGNRLFPAHQVDADSIKILFTLREVVAGDANYGKRYVNFNLRLYTGNEEEFLNQVVPHEIAHLFQRRRWPMSDHHGYEWGFVMISFGLEPLKYHSFDTSEIIEETHPYVWKCCRCQKEYHPTYNIHTKLSKGYDYHCKCGGRLDFIRGLETPSETLNDDAY